MADGKGQDNATKPRANRSHTVDARCQCPACGRAVLIPAAARGPVRCPACSQRPAAPAADPRAELKTRVEAPAEEPRAAAETRRDESPLETGGVYGVADAPAAAPLVPRVGRFEVRAALGQ